MHFPSAFHSLLRRHLTFQLTWSATLSLRIVEYYCRCTMSLGLFSKLHNRVGVVSLYIHVYIYTCRYFLSLSLSLRELPGPACGGEC